MSLLPAALPLLTWIAVTAGLLRSLRSLRQSMFLSGVLLLGFVAVTSEALSAFGLLRRNEILALWLITTAVCCTWWATSRGGLRRRLRASPLRAPYLLCYAVFALTLAVAITAPPNTWDGMTYHMSRVVHWLQNGSLQHYATPITRQNAMPPLAEEAILHLQALTGSDRFANFPAWAYTGLSVLGVHLLAREIQLHKMLVGFCTALAALIPMALFQATSCKNDAINTFLCVAFCFTLTRLAKTWTFSASLLAALTLGLGLYCKGTALLVSGASGLAFALFTWARVAPKVPRSRIAIRLAVVVSVAAVIASPHPIRDRLNSSAQPEPAQTWSGLIGNEDYSPAAVAANLIRNATLHVAVPIPSWNLSIHKVTSWFLGGEISNPKTTFMNSPFMVVYHPHEDYAGNPIHFVLGTVALAMLGLRARTLTRPQQFLLAAVGLAVLFFIAGLKWQPWMSRLHTPVFFLSVPLIGLGLGFLAKEFALGKRTVRATAAVLVLVSAVSAAPALFRNPSRPLLPVDGYSVFTADRTLQYFANRPELYQDYVNVDRIVRASTLNGASIAILCDEDDWEYPLYVFSGAARGEPAYPYHQAIGRSEERVILAMAARRQVLDANPQARCIYRGVYLGLYVGK